MRIRHTKRYRHTPRGVTSRRLAAAERALKREREALPLFAAQVAAQQPTAVKRIRDRDALGVRAEQGMRDLEAQHWRWARQQLTAASDEIREDIIATWNRSPTPPNGSYFASFVRTRLRRAGVAFDDA